MSMSVEPPPDSSGPVSGSRAFGAPPLASLAVDFDSFELRFSVRELVVIATRLGVGLAGLVPMDLVPRDVQSPEGAAFAAVQGSLLARAVLIQGPDGDFALAGPAGAVVAAAFGAALRVTATTVGADIAVRRRWHIRDDIVVTQHLVDPPEMVFGFAPSSPGTVLSSVITECGLPDDRADQPDVLHLDLDALMRGFLAGERLHNADGAIDSRRWIQGDLSQRDNSLDVAELGEGDGPRINLVQRLELDYPAPSGIVHCEISWALDGHGDRWRTPNGARVASLSSSELVRAGGRDLIDAFVEMFPTS